MDADELQIDIARAQELISAHRRTLHELKLQRAQFALNCPAHIITQIENEQKSIADLEREVEQLRTGAAPHDPLDERLRETLKMYLAKSFRADRFARLDQAGESDVARQTELHQVFVDLDVKPRQGPRLRRRAGPPFDKPASDAPDPAGDPQPGGKEALLSAMECLLSEREPWIVLVGGPGQGKSTLGPSLSAAAYMAAGWLLSTARC